jgi:integrase/recombinase XerC
MTTPDVYISMDNDVVTAAHLRHLRLLGRSALTVYHRERALIRLSAALPVPLLEATPEYLYEWRAALAVSGPTIAGYFSNIREFYGWCAGRGFIAANPAADLPVPALPRRQPHPIAEADLLAALDTASRRIRVWLVLAAWCGLRAKEIALLRADCIRIRDAAPHIRVVHDATKGRTERIIPVPPFAAAELAQAGLFTDGMAFRRADGKPLRPWLVSKLCNEHLHAMGIPDTLHSLRHRFLTQAYAVDKDIRVVQELAGHAHIQTTAGYAAIDGAAFARTVNAIPAPRRNKKAS